MKRNAGRNHRYLNQAAEGDWVWLEKGFPPSKSRTTHRGRLGLQPVTSQSGILEPPVTSSVQQTSQTSSSVDLPKRGTIVPMA